MSFYPVFLFHLLRDLPGGGGDRDKDKGDAGEARENEIRRRHMKAKREEGDKKSGDIIKGQERD